MDTKEKLYRIIQTVIFDKPKEESIKLDAELISLAKRHDLAHLLYPYFLDESLKPQYLKAIYRVIKIDECLKNICDIFNKANIPYIPLKGSFLRALYKEPYLRTSCDIDILVHESDLSKCHKLLLDASFIGDGKRGFHDVAYYSSDGIHLELHFCLLEGNDNIDALLSHPWDYASVNNNFQYKFTNEYLYFHHLAHLYHHFINGGCGIRPFIDLKIMMEKLEIKNEQVEKFCIDTNIIKFYHASLELNKYWFEDGISNSLIEQMESFILYGGTYGTIDQSTRVKVGSKGKLRHLLSRIFMPYKNLKLSYPILNKHKILYPFFLIVRLVKFIFKKDKSTQITELKTMNSTKDGKIENINQMMASLEIKA